MNEIFDKLQAVADRYDEVNELLSDPDVIADTDRFMDLSKEEGSLRETVEKYTAYKKVVQQVKDDEELLRENLDDEMAQLTKEELTESREEQENLENEFLSKIKKHPRSWENQIFNSCPYPDRFSWRGAGEPLFDQQRTVPPHYIYLYF